MDIVLPAVAALCTLSLTVVGARMSWMRERPGMLWAFVVIGIVAVVAIGWQAKRNRAAGRRAQLAQEKMEADHQQFSTTQARMQGDLDASRSEIDSLRSQLAQAKDKLSDQSEDSKKAVLDRIDEAVKTKGSTWPEHNNTRRFSREVGEKVGVGEAIGVEVIRAGSRKEGK